MGNETFTDLPAMRLLIRNNGRLLGLLIFFLVSIYGIVTGSAIIALIGLSSILNILSRIATCYSPFDLSTIGVFSLIIALDTNLWIGIVYTLLMWLLAMLWQPFIEFGF